MHPFNQLLQKVFGQKDYPEKVVIKSVHEKRKTATTKTSGHRWFKLRRSQASTSKCTVIGLKQYWIFTLTTLRILFGILCMCTNLWRYFQLISPQKVIFNKNVPYIHSFLKLLRIFSKQPWNHQILVSNCWGTHNSFQITHMNVRDYLGWVLRF